MTKNEEIVMNSAKNNDLFRTEYHMHRGSATSTHYNFSKNVKISSNMIQRCVNKEFIKIGKGVGENFGPIKNYTLVENKNNS